MLIGHGERLPDAGVVGPGCQPSRELVLRFAVSAEGTQLVGDGNHIGAGGSERLRTAESRQGFGRISASTPGGALQGRAGRGVWVSRRERLRMLQCFLDIPLFQRELTQQDQGSALTGLVLQSRVCCARCAGDVVRSRQEASQKNLCSRGRRGNLNQRAGSFDCGLERSRRPVRTGECHENDRPFWCQLVRFARSGQRVFGLTRG